MSNATVDVAFGIELDGEDRSVLAIMPGLAATVGEPDSVTCYAHIGQHSSADLSYCLERLSQADYDEYKDLLEELRRIGYDVRVIRLASIGRRAYADARREQLEL